MTKFKKGVASTAAQPASKFDILSKGKAQTFSMNGIQPILDPEITFARQFRWAFEAPGLAADFAVCKLSYKESIYSNELTISLYDIHKDNKSLIQDWIDAQKQRPTDDNTFTVTTCDGCGNLLGKEIFTECQFIEESGEFNYATSEPCIKKLKFKFDTHKSIMDGAPEKPKDPQYTWKFQIAYSEGTAVEIYTTDMFTCENMVHPQMNVEETKITRMNTSMWLPGRAHWQPLTMTLDTKTAIRVQKAVPMMTPCQQIQSPRKVRLSIHTYSDNKRVETWTLENVLIMKNEDFGVGKSLVTFSFQNVKYEHVKEA